MEFFPGNVEATFIEPDTTWFSFFHVKLFGAFIKLCSLTDWHCIHECKDFAVFVIRGDY